ncbi:MAG: hypothetical protein SNJ75_08255 [Gemmataceae bacterium]
MHRWRIGMTVALLASLGTIYAQSSPAAGSTTLHPQTVTNESLATPLVPPEQLPAEVREAVRLILDAPTLVSKAPAESFLAAPDVYQWLLANPKIAIQLWRLLGAKVSDISEPQPGRYVWRDGQGSEVFWRVIHTAPGVQVWYIEGKAKPNGFLLPAHFRALATLHYRVSQREDGQCSIRHQVQFHLRCDGKAVALAAKLMGASAPRLAEHYLTQLQVFHGGMAWYLCQDKERARRMLSKIGVISAAE